MGERNTATHLQKSTTNKPPKLRTLLQLLIQVYICIRVYTLKYQRGEATIKVLARDEKKKFVKNIIVT